MAKANETRNSDTGGVRNSGNPESEILHSVKAKLDFHFWSRLAVWTLQEAAALCLSLEFKPATASSLARDEGFLRKMQLVTRASQAGLLSDPVQPPDFISWAQRNNVMFPAELELAVRSRAENWVDWQAAARRAGESFEFYKQQYQQKQSRIRILEKELADLRKVKKETQVRNPETVNPKSFGTVLKLIGGMAIAIYNYNPDETRSDVVRQIQTDLDLKGISLDADTIRKWIREGAKAAKDSSINTR